MSHGNLFHRVISLLEAERGCKIVNASPETTLVDDLGIDGDEGLTIIESFANEFHVDLTGFDANNYFHREEAWNPVLLILYFLKSFYVADSSGAKRVPIAIKDLVEIASRHRWQE